MTIQTEDLREQVARIIENYIYVGDDGELRGVEDAIGLVARLVSSTKGGGDLEHLCGSGAQVRPARGLGEPTATPSGWVLVPRQSTLDMEKAGGDADVVNGKSARERNVACGVIWKAMIDAAPAPPSNKKEG